MKSKKCGEAISAYIEAGPGGELSAAAADHLGSCPACRREKIMINRLLDAAGTADLKEAQTGMDWDALAERITDDVFRKTGRARDRLSRRHPAFRPFLRPVMAGLMLGVVVGSLATFYALRDRGRKPSGEQYYASEAFIDRLETEAARRQLVDYLEKSRFILRDIYGSGAGPQRTGRQSGREALKGLLTEKRYLNPQLEKRRMVKAKVVCDQIEMLFQELLRQDPGLSVTELDRLRRLIDESNLLLKINIVKKEIEGEA